MINRSSLLIQAHYSNDNARIVEAEGQVAETYIEPVVLLRKMGYNIYDLVISG